jgi:hypothetical protein
VEGEIAAQIMGEAEERESIREEEAGVAVAGREGSPWALCEGMTKTTGRRGVLCKFRSILGGL